MHSNAEELIFALAWGTFVVMMLTSLLVLYAILFHKRLNSFILEQTIIDRNYQRAILQSQLEIQQETFNSISQEIHDNVGQMLSLAKVQLSILQRKKIPDDLLVECIKENIGKALLDLRDISKSLNSERVQYLVDTVELEVKKINASGILNASMQVKGEIKPLHENKKLVLFRIIQECIQNTIKHASASTLAILFDFSDDNLCIGIRDDGKGFNTNDWPKGLGLQNIFNRTRVIGGEVFFHSVPGEGTNVQLIIPYA